ncbi:MAG TPA: 4Fe-4S ferredoxin [Firmicutes bacterium]|jgi:ferredoxin/flavodoxin|nr:4Fe-4S ferredoxin [Bacillota bacterium]
MKIAIVVFSPSGNTLKVAEMLKKELVKQENEVQLLDITRNREIFKTGGFKDFLDKQLEEHDLLCIGGPVYAHHLHYNVQDVIRSLPRPGGKWGKLAIPFVTYGTISSGIALHEASVLLKRSGRKTIYGMKLEAFHCMSRLLSIQVGKGLPDQGSLVIIRELVKRIGLLNKTQWGQASDITPTLDYQSLIGKLKAKCIFRERFWHRHIYPQLEIKHDSCKLCGQCIKACPVQRLMIIKGTVAMSQGPECIHCGECIRACPVQAIKFQCDLQKWEHLFAEAAEGKGPMPSRERPKSSIYPFGGL